MIKRSREDRKCDQGTLDQIGKTSMWMSGSGRAGESRLVISYQFLVIRENDQREARKILITDNK